MAASRLGPEPSHVPKMSSVVCPWPVSRVAFSKATQYVNVWSRSLLLQEITALNRQSRALRAGSNLWHTTGNIWCVWTLMDDGRACYMASYYDGTHWSNPDTLQCFPTTDTLETFTAGITTDNKNNIWVAYNGGIIWSQYWNGTNWSTPETLSIGYAGTAYTYPTLCSDLQNVWVAWLNSDWNNRKIFCRYHNGISWSNLIEFPIYTFDILGFHNPHQDICTDNQGTLWAGWWEETWAEMEHYFILANSYINGDWDSTVVIDYPYASPAPGGYPSIDYGNNKAWIVWQSAKEGDYNIYVSHTEETGVSEKHQLSNSEFQLRVYPNPFTKYCIVTLCGHNLLRIYNLEGRLIEEVRSNTIGRNLKPGIYFLKVDGCKPVKVIKLR